MQELVDLIRSNQPYLSKRVLDYTIQHGYSKYSSTLAEAGNISLTGLSAALTEAIEADPDIPELAFDVDYLHDRMSSFGLLEARRHRQRGISLQMFLALLKYYRQGFIDLVTTTISDKDKVLRYCLWITRFFDRNEIAFCGEWLRISDDAKISELQTANRLLTNEKNKYLTIFESMPTATVVLNADGRCVNLNYAAQQLLLKDAKSPGFVYYSEAKDQMHIRELAPWIYREYTEFNREIGIEMNFEKTFSSPKLGEKNLLITFQKMLDVSSKYNGTIILLSDMTEYKKIEQQLRDLSYHDQLTGLFNRAYLDNEMKRLTPADADPVAYISVDMDGLKRINDNFGHARGDKILIAVGKMIKSCVRKNDVVARTGDDEFIVMIPNCHSKTADKICRNIREKVLEFNAGDVNIPISLSMGCATGSLNDGEALLKAAHDHMLAEKQMNQQHYENIFQEFCGKTTGVILPG